MQSDSAPNDTIIEGEEEQNTQISADAQLAEQLIWDDGGVSVTVTGLSFDSFMGPSVKLLIENTSEQNYVIQSRDCSINGYIIETVFSADVAAGKKANDEITFMQSDLDAAGIQTIGDIEFYLTKFNDDSWTDNVDSDLIVLKTDLYGTFEQPKLDSGQEIYNVDGLRIVYQGVDEDSLFGASINLFIENTSDEDKTVQCRDLSINGFMIDPIMSADVPAGKMNIDTITVMSSQMEDNGIEKIQDIELKFAVASSNNYFDSQESEIIHITA